MRLDLSRARRSSSEGMEAGSFPEDSLWLEQDAAGITLATLHLLSQWLLAGAPGVQARPPSLQHSSVCYGVTQMCRQAETSFAAAQY